MPTVRPLSATFANGCVRLDWFERPDKTDPVLRAALAHLWFVTIHPFEDGNGRIARAIADMALARSEASPSHAPTERDRRKLPGSSTAAENDRAVTGPMPGIVISKTAALSWLAAASNCRSNSAAWRSVPGGA